MSYVVAWDALPGFDAKLSEKHPRLAPVPLASELHPVYTYDLGRLHERPPPLAAQLQERFDVVLFTDESGFLAAID